MRQCWSKLQSLIGKSAVSDKAVSSCRAALVQAACIGFQALCLCNSEAKAAESYRCKYSLRQGCFQLGLQGSITASSMHRGSGLVSVQQSWSKVQHLIGACAVSHKAGSSLGCRAALMQAACTGIQAFCLLDNLTQRCRTISHKAGSSLGVDILGSCHTQDASGPQAS